MSMKNLVVATSAIAAALIAPAAVAHDHLEVPGLEIGIALALSVLIVAGFSVSRRRLRQLAASKREDRR